MLTGFEYVSLELKICSDLHLWECGCWKKEKKKEKKQRSCSTSCSISSTAVPVPGAVDTKHSHDAFVPQRCLRFVCVLLMLTEEPAFDSLVHSSHFRLCASWQPSCKAFMPSRGLLDGDQQSLCKTRVVQNGSFFFFFNPILKQL